MSEHYSRRSFLSAAALSAGAIALGACKPAVEVKEVEKEVTRVVEQEKVVKETVVVEQEKVVKETVVVSKVIKVTDVNMYTRYANNENYRGIVADFNVANEETNLILSEFGGRDMLTKLTTAIAGGMVPDLAALDIAFTSQFADRDALLDIGDWAEAEGMIDDLFGCHTATSTWRGKFINYPFWYGNSGLFYNRSLLKQAGFSGDGPKNWDELKEMAYGVADLGDDVWGFTTDSSSGGALWFLWAPFMWAAGGAVFDNNYTETLLNTPEAKAAAELWVQFRIDNVLPESSITQGWGEMENQFLSGKSAFICHYQPLVHRIKRDFPDLDFGTTLIPGPKSGQGSSFVGGDGISILAGAQHPQEAWQVIRFMCDARLQHDYSMKNDGVYIEGSPSRRSAIDDAYRTQFPLIAPFVDALEKGSTVNFPTAYEIDKPLKLAFEEMMINRMPVDQAMNALDEEADKIMARYNAERQSS